ncbi:rho guanine nucleotide exchange factor 15 isoform X3 [Ictalurus punctatus]|uniref:Rho guanine nucleotide exchange factor 15 isoform X3 n=1 Tax=Ictalurus punctatus TaxID=7998 RepID=A0A9F7RPV7_ICTPU|nr:rho guanine nucleotide exchange factor 15 isoform X3 [Ictalurus punctatus]
MLARTNMSTPEAARPPPKPELKQKPRIPSKPDANTSAGTNRDMLNKNNGKVHEIVSKFNHHDAQPPAAGPADETGGKKKPKRAPTVKPKPKARSVPQVRAEQAPPLPLKQRQSQRKDAEQNSCAVSRDVTDGRQSAPDGKEFEQQSARSSSDLEPRCEKSCTCVCHLQRPGMKLAWVRISEKEQEEEEVKQTDEDVVNEEESESDDDDDDDDEEEELDMFQSASSESDHSLNESQDANKTRFKATLSIIERQLRRKSDPGPKAVLQSINSLPQHPQLLTKTHSASEQENIYEATIDLIVPPRETIKNTSTTPEIHIQDKSPPAIPPRMPLDKTKGRCVPRRVPLSSGAFQIPKLPSVDLGSSERLQPIRAPPPPPTRCLSNLSLTCKGEDDQSCSGDAENKEQRRSTGLARQKSVDMEAHMPEDLLYQIYTETFISREIRRQTVCRSISKTSADYPMDHGPPRLSTGSGAGSEGLRSSPISTQRTLWQDQPMVLESGILNTITPEECKYQESMFEVLTSEVSYLRSLRVLTDHFMESRELSENLINRDKKTLFSNILRIREVSEKFLKDLENRLDESLLLTDICDIINYHAQHNFPAYIDYIRNQIYQEKTFSSLMQSNVGFATVIAQLQEAPICQRLPFTSFLLLPFQRITRIKILTENILKRTAVGTKQEEMASKALAAVSKIIDECNTQVGKMKQMEELIEINKTLEFDKLKAVPIISQTRFLEKRGELHELAKGATLFNIKPKFTPVYLFLFNDLLVVATKKGSERYVVIDHAHRSLVQVHAMGEQAMSVNLENCFCLTLLENHQGRMMERLFKAPSESDMHRWLAAFPNPEDPNREQEEVIYEDWDCPQVQCVEQYVATQADELNLDPPEIINVIRKTNEGWYEGIRLSDGQKGWFPVKNVLEITSEHMRRRNLRERYRVIQAAGAMTEKTRSGS